MAAWGGRIQGLACLRDCGSVLKWHPFLSILLGFCATCTLCARLVRTVPACAAVRSPMLILLRVIGWPSR